MMTRIGIIVGLGLTLSVIIGAWPFLAFNNKYRRCVHLQNGLSLGFEAVFDLRRPYFQPIAVPKFRDGTPLVKGDIWPIFITNTTVHGLALSNVADEDFWFAWRTDTGLVLKKEDERTYETLVSEAGDANPGVDISTVGTGWLLNELLEKPEFAGQRCQTKLIAW